MKSKLYGLLLPRISCNSNKYTGKPSHKSAHEFDSVQHFTRIYLRSKIAHLLHKQVLQSQNLNTAAILSRPSPSFYRSAAHSHLDPVKSLDQNRSLNLQVELPIQLESPQCSGSSRTLYCCSRKKKKGLLGQGEPGLSAGLGGIQQF